MHCSKCGSLDDKVIDSRLSKDGRAIRRRRECLQCSHRCTTYEEVERSELRVLKRDGRSEVFTKEKLLNGMMKSCEKRPITREMLDRAAEDIIEALEQEFSREIPSHVIGAKVMEKLHDLDQVAYVRFASVYRTFADTDQFIDELNRLRNNFKRSELQPELFGGSKDT